MVESQIIIGGLRLPFQDILDHPNPGKFCGYFDLEVPDFLTDAPCISSQLLHERRTSGEYPKNSVSTGGIDDSDDFIGYVELFLKYD
eukprot:UN27498